MWVYIYRERDMTIHTCIWEFLFCSFAQIGLRLSAHMELDMEPHVELHMELHVELHMGFIWSPSWADRRSGTGHISLHYNKIETDIYIYI